ncbi:DUF4400 domain-containing protein [Cysteiniphilum marinum]|uniref:DUF4400 domain-containing protein n=1 Tax=Cysteiniphilum marinum TaxID=2774191 RepID=UPI00193A30D8|nr:DUF4400 domain-containing protein [Cysteiniphilum marinum]
MRFFIGLFCTRIFSSLMHALWIGVLLEIVLSLVWLYFSKSGVIDHLSSVYRANDAYIASNPVVYDYLWQYPQVFLNGLYSLATGWSDSWLMIYSIVLTAMLIVAQKLLIALINVPLYLVCLIVGCIDGLIGRELRRYRVGIESTKRETFERWAFTLERFTFVAYVSIPLFIPPVLWFLPLFIGVVAIHRMAIVFRQKYM